jgi:UDP-glucuronate 4-epimerase
VRAALEYDRSRYEVINLGNNQTVTLLEMVRGLEEVLAIQAAVEWLPEQPGDVPQTWANIARASRLLDYAPTTTYREGVARFARWLEQSTAAD